MKECGGYIHSAQTSELHDMCLKCRPFMWVRMYPHRVLTIKECICAAKIKLSFTMFRPENKYLDPGTWFVPKLSIMSFRWGSISWLSCKSRDFVWWVLRGIKNEFVWVGWWTYQRCITNVSTEIVGLAPIDENIVLISIRMKICIWNSRTYIETLVEP